MIKHSQNTSKMMITWLVTKLCVLYVSNGATTKRGSRRAGQEEKCFWRRMQNGILDFAEHVETVGGLTGTYLEFCPCRG